MRWKTSDRPLNAPKLPSRHRTAVRQTCRTRMPGKYLVILSQIDRRERSNSIRLFSRLSEYSPTTGKILDRGHSTCCELEFCVPWTQRDGRRWLSHLQPRVAARLSLPST